LKHKNILHKFIFFRIDNVQEIISRELLACEGGRAVSINSVAGQAKHEKVSATSVKTWESTKKLSI